MIGTCHSRRDSPFLDRAIALGHPPLKRRAIAFDRPPLLPLLACGKGGGARGVFRESEPVERPPHPEFARTAQIPISPFRRGEMKARDYPKVEAKFDCRAPKGEGRIAGGRGASIVARERGRLP